MEKSLRDTLFDIVCKCFWSKDSLPETFTWRGVKYDLVYVRDDKDFSVEISAYNGCIKEACLKLQ